MYLALMLPDWLMNEQYITLATWGLVAATSLLVIATFVMYCDSRSKGKELSERWRQVDEAQANEQKLRWEREDKLRADDAKPKVAVEIGKREGGAEIVFICYNLGDTIFFVSQIIITSTSPRQSVLTADLVGPPVLHPGTFMTTSYDCEGLISDQFQEAKAEFVLRGQHGLVKTDPVWFYVSSDRAGGYDWGIGCLADRLPGAIAPQPRLIPKGQYESSAQPMS